MRLRPLPQRVLRAWARHTIRQAKTEQAFVYESARMLTEAFRFVRTQEVRGDYAEFGVWRGDTFVEAWIASRRYDEDIHLYAFDSFEGLPNPSGVDGDSIWHEGQYAQDRRAFEDSLRRGGVPASSVRIVAGFFGETLLPDRRDAIGLGDVAIAWIDCDLYESTVPVLDYLTDRLTDGAVIVFDDWLNFKGRPDRGEQLACSEWLAANPSFRLVPFRAFGVTGQSFIFHRGADEPSALGHRVDLRAAHG